MKKERGERFKGNKETKPEGPKESDRLRRREKPKEGGRGEMRDRDIHTYA